MAQALNLVLVEALDSVLALQVEMGHSVEPQTPVEVEALVDSLPQRLEALKMA